MRWERRGDKGSEEQGGGDECSSVNEQVTACTEGRKKINETLICCWEGWIE